VKAAPAASTPIRGTIPPIINEIPIFKALLDALSTGLINFMLKIEKLLIRIIPAV